MKKLFFTILGLGLCLNLAIGQNINYKVSYDNPDFLPFLNLNVSYLDVDLAFSSLDALNLNAGVWGFFEPIKGLGADFKFRRSYLTMAQLGYKSPPAFSNFEIGGYFRFGGYLKKKATPVVLDVDWDADGNSFNNEEVFQMKSIMVEALNKRDYLVRAGFYHLSSPITVDEVKDANDQDIFADGIGQASINGLYAGIAMRTFRNVFIETNQFGDQFNSAGRTLYADLIFAGTSISDPYEDAATLAFNEDAAKEAIGSLPLGFRVGLSTYQIEKKARTDKKFGMSTNYEVGYRPYLGWYLSAGLGFTLIKWNK